MSKRFTLSRLKNRVFFIAGIFVFAIFLVITVWGKDGLIELMALNHKKRRIMTTNYRLLKENLLYYEEIQKLKQPSYIEQTARSDLGLVRGDEMVFIVK